MNIKISGNINKLRKRELKETFKPMIIDDWEESEIYLISNYGRIFNTQASSFISQFLSGPSTRDYFCVNIKEPNGKRKMRKVHVLLAKTWLSDTYVEGYEVDHKDINRYNNHIDNLRWVTRAVNANNKSTSLHIRGIVKTEKVINEKVCTSIDIFIETYFPSETTNKSVRAFVTRYINRYTENECVHMTNSYIKYKTNWNNYVIDFDGTSINYIDFLLKYKLKSNIHHFKNDLLKTIAIGTFGYNYCFGSYGVELHGMWFRDQKQAILYFNT